MKQQYVLYFIYFSLYLLLITPVTAQAPGTEMTLWARHDLSNNDNPSAVALREHIASFEAETGIRVRYEQVAWDQLAPKLAIEVLSGGKVPDVVEVWSQHMPPLLDAGALAPLDDLLREEAWLLELDERDTEACVLDEVRYCVAYDVRGGMTYYRVDAFPQGFPMTSEGWLAEAATLQGYTYFSTQFMGRNYAAIETGWWPLILSNGGDIFDDEGRPAWVSPQVEEVVLFFRNLYAGGHLPELSISGSFLDAEAPWIAGEAASFRGASWSPIFIPGLRDAVDAGEVALTGGISFKGGPPYVFMVSENWVIPQGAQNPEASRAWMRHTMQADFLSEWVHLQNGIPTLPAAFTGEQFETPFFRQVAAILNEQGRFMQHSPYYLESLDALSVALQELLLNPEMAILPHLQEAADEVLARYW